MKLFISSLILILIGYFTFGQSSNIKLEISSNMETVFLGDNISLSFRIIDPNLISVLNNQELKVSNGGFQGPFNQSSFNYTISVEPLDTGIIKLGPYKINYQNMELSSNVIYIKVVKRKNDNYLLFDTQSVVQLDSEAIIRIRSRNIDISNLKLRDSQFYTIINRSYSSNKSIINGESVTEYIKEFKVSYIKKGILELSKFDILNVTEIFDIDPIKIEIK